MNIEKFDFNFTFVNKESTEEKVCYNIPCDNFSLFGVDFDKNENMFSRMDLSRAKKVSLGVFEHSKHTAGGRLCFSTNANYFELSVKYDYLMRMPHMPLTGSSGFILLENVDGELKRIATFRPQYFDEQGYSQSVALLGDKMRNYILYFPLYNPVNSLSIYLNASAKVERYNPYKNTLPILYYGSSITQGGCASRPDNAYQALICKRNKIDFINLGFSGQGKAEDEMVDYLTTIDCSLFVCDYDHNAPDAEYLQKTHFRLYERYRKVKKDTPILFISQVDFDKNKDAFERREIIKATYQKAKALGDDNAYFLDGQTLFGAEDRDNCTVDGCHPNDFGFNRMALAIYEKIKEINKDFE